MTESIRLMHFDPRWRQEFAQTQSSILQSCEGWVVDVQHVGSTAISGLIARPIIDCIAAVDSVSSCAEASARILGLNFREEPLPDWAADMAFSEERFLIKPRRGAATHHVFLLLKDSPVYASLVRVRDSFLASPELAIAYEEAKVAAWKEFAGTIADYELAKQAFF